MEIGRFLIQRVFFFFSFSHRFIFIESTLCTDERSIQLLRCRKSRPQCDAQCRRPWHKTANQHLAYDDQVPVCKVKQEKRLHTPPYLATKGVTPKRWKRPTGGRRRKVGQPIPSAQTQRQPLRPQRANQFINRHNQQQ